MATGVMGRESIFRGKNPGNRVQATLTDYANDQFEQARAELAQLAGRAADQVSDADTLEYLCRGSAGTRVYLRDLRRGIGKKNGRS
jgi:hypothetical protein